MKLSGFICRDAHGNWEPGISQPGLGWDGTGNQFFKIPGHSQGDRESLGWEFPGPGI